MVSFTRTLLAASVALATLTIGAQADDHTFALQRRARAFGNQPPHMEAALVARGSHKRRGRRCRKSSAVASASASQGSSTLSASSAAPSPSTHHWTSESKSWSPSSSFNSSSPSSVASASASSHASSSAAESTAAESHARSSDASSSTGGNHWASSASPSSKSATPSSSSTSARPTSSSSSSGSGSGSSSGGSGTSLTGAAEGTHTGELTYYGTGLGACGWTNSDSDYIAAIGEGLWTQYGFSNSNKLCGHKIALTYEGKTITVEAVDECPGCAAYDLDLSPSAFTALAPQSLGRLTGATWKFIS